MEDPEGDEKSQQVALVCRRSNVKALKNELERNSVFGKMISPYLDLAAVPPLRSLMSGEEISTETYGKLISDPKEPLFIIFTNLATNTNAVKRKDSLKIINESVPSLSLSNPDVYLTYAEIYADSLAINKSVGHMQKVISNPLAKACIDFIYRNPPNRENASPTELIAYIPRRWSIYYPLVMLPYTAFSSTNWQQYLCSELKEQQKSQFFRMVLQTICPKASHLAINGPIPAAKNKMRKPVNITPLYGDFGISTSDSEESQNPTEETFDKAFWCTVIQNSIFQTWCPLHTMFSRGNITEKARIINEFPLESIKEKIVVDLFAGIGYFAFSYVHAGAAVVLCWEINPWSCEGLLRGAKKNRWEAVSVKENEKVFEKVDAQKLGGNGIRIVLFMEDNKNALSRMKEWKRYFKQERPLHVGHVNLGLLPTSKNSWEIAAKLVATMNWEGRGEQAAWVHVHENIRELEIEKRTKDVVETFNKILFQIAPTETLYVAECGKVSELKAFAPGVIHCVIDVYLFCRPR